MGCKLVTKVILLDHNLPRLQRLEVSISISAASCLDRASAARTALRFISWVSLISRSSTASKSRHHVHQKARANLLITIHCLEAENLLRVAQGTGEKTSCVQLGCNGRPLEDAFSLANGNGGNSLNQIC